MKEIPAEDKIQVIEGHRWEREREIKRRQAEIARTLGIDRSRVTRIKQNAVTGGFLSRKGSLTQTGFQLIDGDVDTPKSVNTGGQHDEG